MTVEELNQLDRESFTRTLGWIFEHSPWVAERAFAQGPFRDADALHGAMTAEVQRATEEEQLALLRAHPDLGARAKLSEASADEQAGAGLDQLTREEFDSLIALNGRYRQKFGFPFLFAVKGSTKDDILQALERRLPLNQDDEFAEALQQVYRIAAFRLEDLAERER